MSSEARLYTFSQETKEHLRKFRLGTSRSNDPQAVIYTIDKKTHEIKQDEEKVVYKTLEDIGDDLPDHSPRFILLSYPLTMIKFCGGRKSGKLEIIYGFVLTKTQPSGRLSVPYVMLYYLPITANSELRMVYAGAKELMRNTSEVGRVIDIETAEDLEEIPAKLGAE